MAELCEEDAGGVGSAAPVRAAQLQQFLLAVSVWLVMSMRCSGGTVERRFVSEPPAVLLPRLFVERGDHGGRLLVGPAPPRTRVAQVNPVCAVANG